MTWLATVIVLGAYLHASLRQSSRALRIYLLANVITGPVFVVTAYQAGLAPYAALSVVYTIVSAVGLTRKRLQ